MRRILTIQTIIDIFTVNLDITKWLQWFLYCLLNALKSSNTILKNVLCKHKFWNDNASSIENERQRKILNKLLDGFDGRLTNSKWAKIKKCSQEQHLETSMT
ncbi:MAG: hypothetical protein FJW56_09745 [Actinobacteria bacterium]|nr:hypothetical protein [Actinomycetota bacterium]